jgi:UDP-N-acetylglucosamine 4,6-dehydratase
MTERILITGGSGFIGRAILKDLGHRWPLASATVYARDPMRLQEVERRFGCRAVMGDIEDYDRLVLTMAGHDTVIHAAAMKHIPQGEANPTQCFRINVEGSINAILAAIAAGVQHLVLISTDKACEPANAYGYSKAMMERIGQEYAGRQSTTAIHIVRYGNVVGSTGSVIPLFQQQARDRVPVTVTEPTMTRFWLTTGMALDAIQKAMAGPTGSIYVPKLPAMKMDRLTELFDVGKGIDIIGMRPGEKLHECLMTEAEANRAINISDGYRIYPVTTPASKARFGMAYTSDDADGEVSPDLMREWIAEGAGI